MLIIDVEASGIDYQKHSVVSVGALDLHNPANRFYGECRIWKGAHIMDGSLAVNGFTEIEINNPKKQSEGELTKDFLLWSGNLEDRTLTAQNVSFDRDMLRAAAERAGLNWDLAHRTLDTHTMCWMHMLKAGMKPPLDVDHKRSALNLDTILNYCGIPAEPEPHNALTGALCHAEVASRLLYDRKLLPEFSTYEIPW
ncbi:MAG: DNA polymerase III epsilon subunit-like protein [Candidatus Paceibacteria bacterium]|jgi:DNA polymerase III epsilon subunit-like protein